MRGVRRGGWVCSTSGGVHGRRRGDGSERALIVGEGGEQVGRGLGDVFGGGVHGSPPRGAIGQEVAERGHDTGGGGTGGSGIGLVTFDFGVDKSERSGTVAGQGSSAQKNSRLIVPF